MDEKGMSKYIRLLLATFKSQKNPRLIRLAYIYSEKILFDKTKPYLILVSLLVPLISESQISRESFMKYVLDEEYRLPVKSKIENRNI